MIKTLYNKELVYPNKDNYYFSHVFLRKITYVSEIELVAGKNYQLELNDDFGNIVSGLIEHKYLGAKDNLLQFEEISDGNVKSIYKGNRIYTYYKYDFEMDNNRADLFKIIDEKFGLRIHSSGEINFDRY